MAYSRLTFRDPVLLSTQDFFLPLLLKEYRLGSVQRVVGNNQVRFAEKPRHYSDFAENADEWVSHPLSNELECEGRSCYVDQE